MEAETKVESMDQSKDSRLVVVRDADLTRRDFLRHAGIGIGATLTLPSLLAACGAGANPAETTTGGTSAPVTSAPELLPTGPAVHLSSVDPTSPLEEALKSAAKQWLASHPDEEVTFENIPFGNFLAGATTRARSGNLGDVVQMLPGQNWAPLFPALFALDRASFENADELVGWGSTIVGPDDPDHHAGVPLGNVGIVWYYNRALFEGAGLDPDNPPQTWDDFTAAAAALKANGTTPIGMSGVDSFFAWWMWMSFSPQVFPAQDDIVAVQSGEIPLDDERFLESLEPVAETYRNDWWNSDFRDQAAEAVEAKFAQGQVAMVSGLTHFLGHWAVWDDTLGPDAYGVFPAPLLPGAEKQGLFFNPTGMLGISKDTEVEGTARGWIEHLTSKEIQTELLRTTSQFPNRTDIDIGEITGSRGAAEIAELVKRFDGGMEAAQNQFNGAATQTALQKLTTAITSDDLTGFLEDLQGQQESQ